MDNTNGAFEWKIKKIVKKGDYLYAVVPEHPKSSKNGYVLAHRIIAENKLKRLLNPDEIVHHINGNKHDNRPENLLIETLKEHCKRHADERLQNLVLLKCPWCEKEFTKRRGYTHLVRPSNFTCCSKSCRGKLSRKLQLHGKTLELEKAISENVLKEYKGKLRGN